MSVIEVEVLLEQSEGTGEVLGRGEAIIKWIADDPDLADQFLTIAPDSTLESDKAVIARLLAEKESLARKVAELSAKLVVQPVEAEPVANASDLAEAIGRILYPVDIIQMARGTKF